MFIPSSLQAEKTFVMGKKKNMLPPIISEYFSAWEHKCQVELMRYKTTVWHKPYSEDNQHSDWVCESNIHWCFKTHLFLIRSGFALPIWKGKLKHEIILMLASLLTHLYYSLVYNLFPFCIINSEKFNILQLF